MQEKKEKRFYDYKGFESKYQPFLDECRKMTKMTEPLVYNNLNIIYNLHNTHLRQWKKLSMIEKMVVFFEYVVDESWQAVSLRFSNRFIDKGLENRKVTDFIRRRINQNLKNKIGFVPEYMFSVEYDENGFHLHGVILPQGRLEEIIKIFKTTAFGINYSSNPIPERNKINTKPIYDKLGWMRYMLKSNNQYKKNDLYLCNSIIRKTRQKYNEIYSIKMKILSKK